MGQTHKHTDRHTDKVCRSLQSTDCDDKIVFDYWLCNFTVSLICVSGSETSTSQEGASAVSQGLQESSSDVSMLEPATTRYLKLIAAAAAFSLAAFGVKKVVDNLPK